MSASPPPGAEASRPPPPISIDVSDELAALASARPEEKPAFRIGLLVAAVLTVTVLGGGGYFAYRTFLAAPADNAQAHAKPSPRSTAGTATTVLKQAEHKARELASVPGQLIDKAQDAIAARRENEQDRVDNAIVGRDYNGERALKTRTPDEIAERLGKAEPARAPEQTVVHLDLGSSATPPPATPAPAMELAQLAVAASPAFKTYVTAARINGVFQGNPPRALINGRTVRAGDMLDTTLGVVFERIDASRKLVFFKDQSGAVLAKKY
ncbi:MAG TPA: hypothetical protein VGD81_12220 [Opitutaceae bacterium]